MSAKTNKYLNKNQWFGRVRYKLLFLLSLVMLGCTYGSEKGSLKDEQKKTSNKSNKIVNAKQKIDKTLQRTSNTVLKYVILSAKEPFFSFYGWSEWKLTSDIVEQEEKNIINCIKEQRPDIYSKLLNYRVQYFGIINNKKKGIYCNYFRWEEDKDYWKNERVEVMDGGNSYFQIQYDIETKKCLKFWVNGHA